MSEVNDIYKEPIKISESLFKDKGSKHFGYVFPVKTEDEIAQRLKELRKKHHSARHVCYAWTLGSRQVESKFTDDGEPHNSAGPPILGQINSFELHNTLIAVVRYFGGTKLGVGGLINAYKTAAKEAILDGEIIDRYLQDNFRLTFPYEIMSDVMRISKKDGVTIKLQNFTENCILEVSIRLKFKDQILDQLNKLHLLEIKAL